jgi:hypothetical protein
MSYQTEQIRNTYCLRVALIQHIFTKVVPVPFAPDHPDRATKCFWAQPMRYETQADLLRMLNMVTQHYTASVFSLKLTRSFDAARILTMSCIAAIADCVARTVVTDTPSEFSTHLNGTAEGPCHPFGFEIGCVAAFVVGRRGNVFWLCCLFAKSRCFGHAWGERSGTVRSWVERYVPREQNNAS